MCKKILYGLTLMAVMASCTDDYTDWASPLTNPEETAQSVTFSASNAAAVNYAALSADEVQLFVPSVTATVDDVTTSYIAVLYNADKSANQVLAVDNADAMVDADVLKNAVEALYGKRPEAHDINMDITAYTAVGTQTISNTGSAVLNVTLKAPYIDSGYYLTGDFAGWNQEGALAFTHIGNGDVYDNPEFQIVFQTTGADQYWKIIPAGNYNGDFWAEGETGVVGTVVDGDTSFEGNLTTTSPQAGKIAEQGIYRMTINMMNYTYKLEKMNFTEFIYEIGNESSWSTAHPLYGANFDGKYQGYYFLNGEFKFKPNKDDWNGDWGQEPDADYGRLVQEGEWNCWLNEGEGFYQIDVDVAAMTYSLTKVNSISIIGTVNGNWDTDTDLEYNQQSGAWEVTTTLSAGAMKFRMNHDWAISWGGANGDPKAYDNLTQKDGKDLDVTEAGTYKIQLFIAYEGGNRVVITKQ